MEAEELAKLNKGKGIDTILFMRQTQQRLN